MFGFQPLPPPPSGTVLQPVSGSGGLMRREGPLGVAFRGLRRSLAKGCSVDRWCLCVTGRVQCPGGPPARRRAPGRSAPRDVPNEGAPGGHGTEVCATPAPCHTPASPCTIAGGCSTASHPPIPPPAHLIHTPVHPTLNPTSRRPHTTPSERSRQWGGIQRGCRPPAFSRPRGRPPALPVGPRDRLPVGSATFSRRAPVSWRATKHQTPNTPAFSRVPDAKRGKWLSDPAISWARTPWHTSPAVMHWTPQRPGTRSNPGSRNARPPPQKKAVASGQVLVSGRGGPDPHLSRPNTI